MADTGQKFSKKEAIGLAFELGYIIALPILAFGLAGKYLDVRWHTDPWLKIAGLVVAIIATTIWLTRRFSEILRSMRGK